MLGISIAGLVVTFILGEYCGFILKIRGNKFFNKFHFAGGFFLYLLFISLTNQVPAALILTLITGGLWEVHEWILYFTILKRSKFHKPDDWLTDLFFDMLGATAALVLLFILKI